LRRYAPALGSIKSLMSFQILDSWQQLVSESPDACALFHPDGSVVTRQQLEHRSDLLSSDWRLLGVRPRRLLVIHLSHGEDWIVAFLACLKLNMVAVCIDQTTPRDEAELIARKLRAEALWNGSELCVFAAPGARYFRGPDIVLGKLTSGSTGQPRVYFFTDNQMMADGRNVIHGMGLRSEDTNLGVIPWGHSYGLGNIVYPLLIQGTRATWTDSAFPQDIATVCQRVKTTVFPAIPTILRALTRSQISCEDFLSLRLVISAGARLEPELAQLFEDRFKLIPKNFYGSTETGGIAFDADGEASLSGRSVGRLLAGVQILDTQFKRFRVSSAAVYSYGNRAQLHQGQCSFRSVDFGSMNTAGELVLEKRAKSIIKIGGRRINPSDVEARLEKIPMIRQALVFELNVDGEPVLAAAVESSAGRSEIIEAIRTQVPKRLRPKKIRVIDLFPCSARGKVMVQSIKGLFL
jgi:long-chain acyl-CoA synthetase